MKENRQKKRVMCVIPSLQGSGAERLVVDLVNHLDRSRYEPILALGAVEGPYLKEVREDVTIYPLGSTRARAVVPAIVQAVWSLRPETVFALLGFHFSVALARPLFPPGTRVVFHYGTVASAFLKEIELKSRTRAWFYRLLYRTLYRLPDTIVCQCDYMLNDLATNFALPMRKLTRIYTALDMEKIKRLASNGESPYVGRGPHLLTIGNMTYAKGYDILLPAFKLVRQRYPHATLTFVGNGENRPALESLTGQLGLEDAVHFAGFQSNPFSYLKHADLFISSSRYEGGPLVVVEAMACGTPVVATDCPSANREVVEEGVNGWLAKSEDVLSLAETICKGIAEGPALDRDLIRAKCEARFSLNHIMALYETQL